ncbi:MAG: hypothetical protein ACE5DI_01555 [Candidatus Micrarchaeia archaeon]
MPKKPRKGSKKNNDYKLFLDVLKFVAFFAILFFPLNYAFSNFYELKVLAAVSSQVLLEFTGIPTSIDFSNADPRLVGSGFIAEITALCAAATEFAALIALVAASIDRSVKQRIAGILAGALFVLAVNPVRIAATLHFYDPEKLLYSSLLHDVFFRISIIVALVVFYAVWYYWKMPAKFK